MDIKEFAKRVKARRSYVGMSQEELAKIIGWTQGGFAGLESGRNKNMPSKEVIEAIARALNTVPEELIGASDYFLEKFSTEVRNWMLTDKNAVAAINATFIREMEAKINATMNKA